jgi:hypothetical protein
MAQQSHEGREAPSNGSLSVPDDRRFVCLMMLNGDWVLDRVCGLDVLRDYVLKVCGGG